MLVEASRPVMPEVPPMLRVELEPWGRVEPPERAVVTVRVLLLVVALETVMVALTMVVPPMVAVPEPLTVRLS